MGTYFQKDLQIPRDWVWPHNKAKTMEHYYTTLMALHLWDENMQFPPLTHKDQTYPIPKFWQPPPAEETEPDLSNQGQILSEQSRANSLPLFTAQQATQQANQAALEKMKHPSTSAALTQPKQGTLRTHKQLIGQMNQLFPTNTVTPITTTHTLASQGTSTIPGTYVQLPSGIMWDPAQDTYRSKSGIQMTPQKFTYQPQDDKDYTWTPDIQLTTLRPVNRSLNSAQYENYCNHQRHLQHLHLGMEWPANTEIPVHYQPNSRFPSGIAGVEYSCLIHESELKIYLVADRYSGPTRMAAMEQAHQFRIDLAKSWHLPLLKLFSATDAHLQLKAHSAKIMSVHKTAAQPLDKNTTKALQSLQQTPAPQRSPSTSQQGQQPRYKPPYIPQQSPAPSTSSPIIHPVTTGQGNTPPSQPRQPSKEYYRGKNHDSYVRTAPHQGEDKGGWR